MSLTNAEAKRWIAEILKSGEFIITTHAQKSMKERNFDNADAKYVCKHGNIKSLSFDQTYDNWKIEIEGEDLQGDGLTVHLGLDIDNRRIVLVTGHSPREKK